MKNNYKLQNFMLMKIYIF